MTRHYGFRYLCAPLLFALLFLGGCRSLTPRPAVVYQTASIAPLLEGGYDSSVTLAQLRRQGDFGVGTFNHLDGEMVLIGGDFYQVRSDGVAYPAAGGVQTPFATVTFFHCDQTLKLPGKVDLEHLLAAIDRQIPSPDLYYAIRIDGLFERVRTRSVPAQRKPYPRLIEVARRQPEFELKRVRGTLIGFRLPDSVKGDNIPGYHLHFITADRKAGGHVLGLEAAGLEVRLGRFRQASLAGRPLTVSEKPARPGSAAELKEIEQGRR